ncbi:MAG: hypothetical protein ACI93S_000168 [Ancylomarina sp.]|jgi:hypothetical protein
MSALPETEGRFFFAQKLLIEFVEMSKRDIIKIKRIKTSIKY